MLLWRVLNAVLVTYLLLITLRIMLSWFQRSAAGRPWELLIRVTEPYLALFRRMRFLSIGPMDLSPIAGILVLVMALDLLGALQAYGKLSVGIVLAALAGALWSGISFLVLLLLVIVIVLILFGTFRRGYQTPLSQALASLVEPLVVFVRDRLVRALSPRRPLGAMQLLLLASVLLIVVLIGGRALILLLRTALLRLPF